MELWDILDKDRNVTGRFMKRGDSMDSGEYHLAVFTFIKNLDGRFLISKRTPNKTFPNTWEITAGAAIKGDNSLKAILREIKEELGIELKSNRKVIKSIRKEGEHSYFADIWLFEEDIDFSNVICQPEEVSEAKLATKDEINELIRKKLFMVGMPTVLECLEFI